MNKASIKSFEDLEVWKQSIVLGKKLYLNNRNNLADPIINQLLRASVSISNNIAEGHDRSSTKDYIRFLYISRGSCAELRSLLILASEVKVLNNSNSTELIEQTLRITRMLSALINSLKRRL